MCAFVLLLILLPHLFPRKRQLLPVVTGTTVSVCLGPKIWSLWAHWSKNNERLFYLIEFVYIMILMFDVFDPNIDFTTGLSMRWLSHLPAIISLVVVVVVVVILVIPLAIVVIVVSLHLLQQITRLLSGRESK